MTAAALFVAACGADHAPAKRADRRVQTPTLAAALGDSVAVPDDIEGTIWLRRVVVRDGQKTDTLRGVFAMTPPLVVGDSLVYGAIADGNASPAAFAYHAGSRAVDRIPWPVPSVILFPSFAPDGRHVALIAADSVGAHVVVANWPRSDVMLRGAPVALQATDFPATEVAWRGSDTAIVRIDGALVGGRSRNLRYRVSIPSRVIVVDTVAKVTP